MTPEARAVVVAAIEVAIEPPTTKAKYAMDAKVSWSKIKRLREALDAADIPWREAKAGTLEVRL